MRSHFVNTNHIEIVRIGFQKKVLVTFLITYLENKILVSYFFYNPTSTNLKRNKMSHYFSFLTGPVLIFKNELRCILVPKSEKKEKSIHTVVLLS